MLSIGTRPSPNQTEIERERERKRGGMNLVPISHEEEGGDAVEHGHPQVGHGQVGQEVVGDVPHPTVT